MIRRACATIVVAWPVIALVATGCASRSTSDRFVKKSQRFIDVGGTEQSDDPVAREEVDRVIREAVARRAASRPAQLASIETQDAGLAAALADHRNAPSVGTHLRVAGEYDRVRVDDMALGHYSDALALDPRNVAAYDGRARVWRDAGLLLPALSDAHHARYFGPKSAEARNTLGTILERQGLCKDALAEYQSALKLSSGAPWAQQNVTRLTETCEKANPKNP